MLPHEKQILEYEKTMAQLKAQNRENALWSDDEIAKLETKLEQLKKKVYSQLTSWERVSICRHPARPRSIDYIRHLCEDFFELLEIASSVTILLSWEACNDQWRQIYDHRPRKRMRYQK